MGEITGYIKGLLKGRITHVKLIERRIEYKMISRMREIADFSRWGEKTKYFNPQTGGYYIVQKGHEHHTPEIEAARILADKGYRVVMQPEGKGGVILQGGKYPDGKINKIWYDQWTSDNGSIASVKHAIQHGHEKGVTHVVLYDRNNLLTESNYQKGKSNFFRFVEGANSTKVKFVYIVNGKTKEVKIVKLEK